MGEIFQKELRAPGLAMLDLGCRGFHTGAETQVEPARTGGAELFSGGAGWQHLFPWDIPIMMDKTPG